MDLWTMQWKMALAGGLIIGASVTFMLLFTGRVTGISGIFNGVLHPKSKEWGWRSCFIGGLILGGLILQVLSPNTLQNTLDHGPLRLAIAGLLVGYGTRLGSGCTSGHGVCGISRFSLRSITATLTFMTFGILIVAVLSKF